MLPITDDAPARIRPWLLVGLIVLNVLVLCIQSLPIGPGATLIATLGLIPSRFMRWVALGGEIGDPWRYLPIGTSMFLHDGWVHLGTNMIYLFAFGRALEDRLGRAGLFATYVLSGVAAALGQLIAHPGSNAAMIGASGAIAGLLGAYLVSFPNAKITVAFPFLYIPWVLKIRAFWFLGGWFALQLGKGLTDVFHGVTDPQVAWWAHATGFLAGTCGALAGRAWEQFPIPLPTTVGSQRRTLPRMTVDTTPAPPPMYRPSLVPARVSRLSMT